MDSRFLLFCRKWIQFIWTLRFHLLVKQTLSDSVCVRGFCAFFCIPGCLSSEKSVVTVVLIETRAKTIKTIGKSTQLLYSVTF